MNYRETDDNCEGCGSWASDRKRSKPEEPQGLSECPHCNRLKCCMCDMGDDVECCGCDREDDD